MSEHVTIVEMSPRDGLQNESNLISTVNKIRLIDELSDCGFSKIEVTSFVSPKWVPQLADASEVMVGIKRKNGVKYCALTPNQRGLEVAIKSKANEIAIFASASEGFSQKNINCSVPESILGFNIAPNWLDWNFHADRPNQKWAGDISYVWTRQGWLYLAVIIDLHSRRVVGWAVSNRLKKDLALQALNRAVALRNPPPGCLHHTDRGSQYCSHDYQKRMRQLDFKVSPFGGASLACRAMNEPERKLLGQCRGGDILQNAQS